MGIGVQTPFPFPVYGMRSSLGMPVAPVIVSGCKGASRVALSNNRKVLNSVRMTSL